MMRKESGFPGESPAQDCQLTAILLDPMQTYEMLHAGNKVEDPLEQNLPFLIKSLTCLEQC